MLWNECYGMSEQTGQIIVKVKKKTPTFHGKFVGF